LDSAVFRRLILKIKGKIRCRRELFDNFNLGDKMKRVTNTLAALGPGALPLAIATYAVDAAAPAAPAAAPLAPGDDRNEINTSEPDLFRTLRRLPWRIA
jgi:hypothetical protein